MALEAKLVFFLLYLFVAARLRLAYADVHHHEFLIEDRLVKRLCKTTRIVTVNGQFPGPTLEVKNGDSLVINVVNGVKYNATIHWHGVRQMRNGWADGPAYVTQCPIKYGESYTYRFNIEDQEGTLFWHAHTPWMRSTVYGAIVIRPKAYSSYPFPKPDTEALVILGEWWIKEFIETAEKDFVSGGAPEISDALLINGQPGDLFDCSSNGNAFKSTGCSEIAGIEDGHE